MLAANELQPLEKVRRDVARKVRELRTGRHWTQEELARQLDLSQGYLSQLERGTGSFTAEQLLRILSLFNVPASFFTTTQPNPGIDLQNALARLGAAHLRESTSFVPSERFDEIANVVRETLASPSPRQVTALGAVLVANADRIPTGTLQLRVAEVGLGRRLGWLVENVLEAIRHELGTSPKGGWTTSYRRAELVLGFLRDSLAARFPESPDHQEQLDIFDSTIVTKKTVAEVRASSSSISKHWGIVTSLAPQDFVDALKASRAGR